MDSLIYAMPAMGIVALLYVAWKSAWVSKQEVGTEKMVNIADNIAVGAMSFLKAEYKVLAIFVVAVAILLAFKGASEANSSPLVGKYIATLLFSGSSLTARTVTRMYFIHVFILPVIVTTLIIIHLFIVWVQGIAEPH